MNLESGLMTQDFAVLRAYCQESKHHSIRVRNQINR